MPDGRMVPAKIEPQIEMQSISQPRDQQQTVSGDTPQAYVSVPAYNPDAVIVPDGDGQTDRYFCN